jgi:hypothetical protein
LHGKLKTKKKFERLTIVFLLRLDDQQQKNQDHLGRNFFGERFRDVVVKSSAFDEEPLVETLESGLANVRQVPARVVVGKNFFAKPEKLKNGDLVSKF